MSPLESEYIKACETEQKRERRAVQMRWASIVGAIAFALVVGVLAANGQLNRFIYRPLTMEWVTVPAGEFMMGSEDAESDESPVHTVYLDTYEIGMYEVTNEQYYQCIKADVCEPLSIKRYSDPLLAAHPVVYVSWNEADTFCGWNDPNGRLPTEAEWEKAARGTDGRTYPWGDDVDCSFANYFGKDKGNGYCVGDTAPVGSYPEGVSPYGAYDMAGNVWEWVADWYASDYYASSPETNPLGPNDGIARVLRGGSWRYNSSYVRSADRSGFTLEYLDNSIGFRCSRSSP